MDELITLTIDNQSVSVPAGTTLLEAARQLNADIPAICFHEACTANALCRTCSVEVQGSRLLAASCITPVAQGQVVHTASERVQRARRTILEMLASTVDLTQAPGIQQMLDNHQADPNRFPDSDRRNHDILDDNPMYVRDYSKCVLCWRCVQVCADDAQYTYAINFSGRGFETSIATFFDVGLKDSTCVFCGQCIGVCPTNALQPKREYLLAQGYDPATILDQTPAERRSRRSRKP